ncbi:unnamed protein product [Gongylonema pulchrum]|uniref:Rab-GAP TBC domain-containing protein n=1 Tax=Gongylonema pulchrum TaxID=637853 RepID=A0A3P7M8F7_9BILA|nr:unnamed protein product [Gongylonema pulchrum]
MADHYIGVLGIDWEETCRCAFSDKINPHDDRLSLQIIKDLHRTGWSSLKGDEEKLLLKRVLLGYARFNMTVGYCQGFNVIAENVLEVMEYKEEIALKVIIFLIEHVLPRGYFDRSLYALSVDMAVLKDLLYQRLPKTAKHLDDLQHQSRESSGYELLSSEHITASEFEPPLTNVFSMQWFLTIFATSLPKSCLYRIWDALMLEGSEVLLRCALVIWTKFSPYVV